MRGLSQRLRNYAGISIVITGLIAALVYEAKHTGLTIDEPSHFAAGYAYWLGEDILIPADTPPFTRLLGGWVARIRKAPDLHQSKHWASGDAYLLGTEILGAEGKTGRLMLFYSRLPFLLFPVGLVLLVWHWARQLFNQSTAIILATCTALEPTILGHGVLIKSDVAAAFAALWFTYNCWRHWQTPTVKRMLLLSCAVTLAVLTKFTLLPLFFIGYALALWRGPKLLSAFTMPLVLYIGILAVSQFKAEPIPPSKVMQFAGASVPSMLIPAATLLARLPWPPQFIEGLLYIGGSLHGEGFQGYMLGRNIRGWVPGYFPFTWAVKFPIPLQLLTLAGLCTFLLNATRKRLPSSAIFICGAAIFFFGSAMLSNFHIGFRHVMPALPLFILLGGFPLQYCLSQRPGRIIAALGLLWLTLTCVAVYPFGISYCNEWIGGPKNGWKYLADSNIDWGQNYPELGAYLKKHNITDARAFLFSFDNIWHYTPEGTVSPQAWPPPQTTPGQRYVPVPGTYVISVNILTGLLLPPGHENYLQNFRERTPTARAGYSILIYTIE